MRLVTLLDGRVESVHIDVEDPPHVRFGSQLSAFSSQLSALAFSSSFQLPALGYPLPGSALKFRLPAVDYGARFSSVQLPMASTLRRPLRCVSRAACVH